MKTHSHSCSPQFTRRLVRQLSDSRPNFIAPPRARYVPPKLRVLADKDEPPTGMAFAGLTQERQQTDRWEKIVYGILGAAGLAGVAVALL